MLMRLKLKACENPQKHIGLLESSILSRHNHVNVFRVGQVIQCDVGFIRLFLRSAGASEAPANPSFGRNIGHLLGRILGCIRTTVCVCTEVCVYFFLTGLRAHFILLVRH